MLSLELIEFFKTTTAKLGIEISDEQINKFSKYGDLLLEWNKVMNLTGITEYEEVNERYTFLSSQRDDLLKAKDTLYSIIEEMDEMMAAKRETKNSPLIPVGMKLRINQGYASSFMRMEPSRSASGPK